MNVSHKWEVEIEGKGDEDCKRQEKYCISSAFSVLPACLPLSLTFCCRMGGSDQAANGADSNQDNLDKQCSAEGEMFSPCLCRGSGRWVHRSCLQEWRVKSDRNDSYHT
eukprot:159448-Hanusia_phi.AAC.1